MNPSARRARRLLRSARRGPWGNGKSSLFKATKPVYSEDGTVEYYKLVTDPWYVNRDGLYKVGSWHTDSLHRLLGYRCVGPKARQVWLKDWVKDGKWEIGHVLSTCCGWGNEEGYGGQPQPHAFTSGSVPPEPNPNWRRVVKQKRHRRKR